MPHKDPEVARAYRRRRYHANREARRAKNRSDSVLYRQRHPEKIAVQNFTYYHENLERERERSRTKAQTFREEHPEEARAYARAHPRDPEKQHASNQAYYYANTPALSAYARKYRQEHPEEIRLYQQAYRQAHPEKKQADAQRRRAKKAGAPRNDLTHAQWLEIQDAQDHRCYYCGKRCKGRLTQDHIIPLSKGGSHTLHNVIGACQSCNSKKHDGAPFIPVQPLLLTIAPARKKKTS
jgi:5-methylcytosine-specific restriction endonuclease McrA